MKTLVSGMCSNYCYFTNYLIYLIKINVIDSPVTIMFALSEYRNFFKEWQKIKNDYHSGAITRDVYVEWKLQWYYKYSTLRKENIYEFINHT